MPDWTVKIVSSSTGGTQFSPKTQQAQQDDLVCWNNTTNDTHQPWPLGSDGQPIPAANLPRNSPLYLSDPIPPGRSSRPSYDVAQPAGKPKTWTVNYCCLNHKDNLSERGTIQASVIPVLPPPPATDDDDS